MNLDAISPLFEDKLLDEIQQVASFHVFEKETIVVDIGQRITHIPLVLSGSLKIIREDAEGQELLLYYLEPGDSCSVSLNCCSTQQKSNIRAIVEEAVSLLFVPAEKMEQWLIQYQSWRRFVLDSLNTRFEEMLGAIDQLAFHNMEKRCIHYLKNKALIQKTTEIKVTHAEIALDLHSSRVVVSRILKILEQKQQIVQKRNLIVLLLPL